MAAERVSGSIQLSCRIVFPPNVFLGVCLWDSRNTLLITVFVLLYGYPFPQALIGRVQTQLILLIPPVFEARYSQII